MKKLIASLLAATMLAGTASAQVLGSYPYTLTNGSLADANQVMSNFNYITTQVNANTCTLAGCTFTGPVYGTALSLSSTLGVSGAATVSGILTASNGFYSENWTINGSNSLYIYDAGSGILGFRSGSAGAPRYANLDATGTFNVLNGGLTVAGNTSLSGTLGVTGLTSGSQFTATNAGSGGQYAAVNGSTVGILRNDGNNFYILKNNASTTAYDAARPFTVNLSTGNVVIDSTGSGGTSVGGTLGVTGNSIFTGGVTLNGTSGPVGAALYINNASGSYGAIQYLYNSTGGATNPAKQIRINSSGGYEIVNSANTAVISTLTDSGNLSISGQISSSQFNGSGAGLTGTASSLSIGGNAATATNATNATNATTATNVSGGSVSATSGTFSSAVSASSFSGAGTGLTGTASSLSIGGNAATATNATTATNVSGGGTVSASTITAAGSVTAGSFAGAALASAAQTLTGSSTTQAITPGGFAGNSSLGVSGYYKLPGGLIEQWLTTGNIGTSTTVSYPTSCASAVLSIQATAIYGGTPEAINVVTSSVGLTSAQFSINGVAAPAYVRILCI